MTSITIYQNRDYIKGFKCLGHAGFGEYGSDIVCAGVSTLVINTINSIDTLTVDKFSLDTDEDKGLIDFKFEGEPSDASVLLIKSMLLGLQGIQNDYGKKFLSLVYKEV